MTAHSPGEVPDAVLDEAIMWMVRLQSGDVDPQRVQACIHWRQASPLHERAWQGLLNSESAFARLAHLPGIPAGLAKDALGRLPPGGIARRRLLTLLGTGVVVGSLGWQGPGVVRRWGADYSTAIGERRTVMLVDGTELQLNTRTTVNVEFDDQRRLIRLLEGEVFINTGSDDQRPIARRSFWVHTDRAQLQALGTAFTVRQDETACWLRVEQSRVVIHQQGHQYRVEAGEDYRIDERTSQKLHDSPMDLGAWADGELVARSLPLASLLAELGRYQRGWLTCEAAVAQLPVSGVFQLDDIDRCLEALADTLPIRVEQYTRWWRRVVAR